jgi:hypothetical protein
MLLQKAGPQWEIREVTAHLQQAVTGSPVARSVAAESTVGNSSARVRQSSSIIGACLIPARSKRSCAADCCLLPLHPWMSLNLEAARKSDTFAADTARSFYLLLIQSYSAMVSTVSRSRECGVDAGPRLQRLQKPRWSVALRPIAPSASRRSRLSSARWLDHLFPPLTSHLVSFRSDLTSAAASDFAWGLDSVGSCSQATSAA